MSWPALRKIDALYRAAATEASLKADIIWNNFRILRSDPAFQDFMELTIDQLLGVAQSHNGVDDTFFLMTTAMNYMSNYHDARPHRMTEYWPRIRDNIKQCVVQFRPAMKVRIIHFVVTAYTENIDRAWRARLEGEDFTEIDSGFPKTREEMEGLHIHLHPQNHILVDMANLVEHAQDPLTAVGSYADYDPPFVRTINHVYLQYMNFVNGIKANTGPLIRFEDDHMLKACFDAGTLSASQATRIPDESARHGTCKGRCGHHAEEEYCSVCSRVVQQGGDPRVCKVCSNFRNYGSERCQTCMDSDLHAPPVILRYVRATEICPDNR